MVDPPASLWEALGCDSKAGRGILEAGLLLKVGTVPRPFGVPLIVPLEAIAGRQGQCCLLCRKYRSGILSAD
jgi:hypothetical protein